jgi:hypothetical protein
VVTGSWAGQGERARWQRRAAAELAAILDACPGLPVIAWTVAPTGSVLTGQVSGLAPAARVREVFGAWRLALALADYRERQVSAGTTWLHAAARRGEVKVRLTATVFEDEDEDEGEGEGR